MNRLGFLIRTITGRMDAWRWLIGGALLVAVIRGTDVPRLLQMPLTVVQFACLLGALLTLWFKGRKIHRASLSWLHFVAIALGLFAALSAVWSPIPLTTLSRSLIFLLLLVLVFESARIRWSEAEPAQNDLMLLFWFAVLVSGVGLLFAIFQLDIAWGPYNRLKGLTANADVAAWIAALAFPLGYARLLVPSRPRRIWYIAGILILTVTVVATGTRGALVGIGAAILIIHWVRAKSWKVKLAFVGTIFAIAVLLPFGLLPGGRIAESTTDVSSGRLGLWSAGLNLWRHKPVGGWGFGTTSSLPGFAGQNGLSLHNAYLLS